MNLNKNLVKDIRSSRSERTIAFYDAVMAIAITILVLEMNVTAYKHFTFAAIKDLFIPFTALLTSFILLGEVWLFHNRTFSIPLIREQCAAHSNLWGLIFVVLFPKATEVIAHYTDNIWSGVVYVLCVTGLIVSTGLIIWTSIGRAAQEFFRDSSIELPRGRIYPETLPSVIRYLSNYKELREAYYDMTVFYKLEIGTFVSMMVCTFGAAVSLMIYPPVCYIFILANIISELVLRSELNKLDLAGFPEEFTVYLERIEEIYKNAEKYTNEDGTIDFEKEVAALSAKESFTSGNARLRAKRLAKQREERDTRREKRRAERAEKLAEHNAERERRRAERAADHRSSNEKK